MVLGIRAMVFFSGMPSDAAGPVADSVTPTLMSACADSAAAIRPASNRGFENFILVSRGLNAKQEKSKSRSKGVVESHAGIAAIGIDPASHEHFLALVERQHDAVGQRMGLAGQHESGSDLLLVEREVALHADLSFDQLGAASPAHAGGARERHFEPGGGGGIEDARLALAKRDLAL